MPACSEVDIPYRCPRCGDGTTFTVLSDLRQHLSTQHSYVPTSRKRVQAFNGSKGAHSGQISPLLQSFHDEGRRLEKELQEARDSEMNNKLKRYGRDGTNSLEKKDFQNVLTLSNQIEQASVLFYQDSVNSTVNAVTQQTSFSQQNQSRSNDLNSVTKHISPSQQNQLCSDELSSMAQQHQSHSDELSSVTTQQQNQLCSVDVSKCMEKTAIQRCDEQKSAIQSLNTDLKAKEVELKDSAKELRWLKQEQQQLKESTDILSQKTTEESQLLGEELEKKEAQLSRINWQLAELRQNHLGDWKSEKNARNVVMEIRTKNHTRKAGCHLVDGRSQECYYRKGRGNNRPMCNGVIRSNNDFRRSVNSDEELSSHDEADYEIEDILSEELRKMQQEAVQKLQEKDRQLIRARKRSEQLEKDRLLLLREMESLLSKATNDNDNLKSEIRSKDEELQKFNDNLADAKKEQSLLVSETFELYRQADKNIAKLKQMVILKNFQLKAANEKLNQFEMSNDHLLVESESVVLHAEEKGNIMATMLKTSEQNVLLMEKELNGSKYENEKLKTEAENLKHEVEMRSRSLVELQEEVVAKENELAKTKDDLKTLKTFLKTTAAKESVARRELETFIMELIQRADRAEKELRALKRELGAASVEKESDVSQKESGVSRGQQLGQIPVALQNTLQASILTESTPKSSSSTDRAHSNVHSHSLEPTVLINTGTLEEVSQQNLQTPAQCQKSTTSGRNVQSHKQSPVIGHRRTDVSNQADRTAESSSVVQMSSSTPDNVRIDPTQTLIAPTVVSEMAVELSEIAVQTEETSVMMSDLHVSRSGNVDENNASHIVPDLPKGKSESTGIKMNTGNENELCEHCKKSVNPRNDSGNKGENDVPKVDFLNPDVGIVSGTQSRDVPSSPVPSSLVPVYTSSPKAGKVMSVCRHCHYHEGRSTERTEQQTQRQIDSKPKHTDDSSQSSVVAQILADHGLRSHRFGEERTWNNLESRPKPGQSIHSYLRQCLLPSHSDSLLSNTHKLTSPPQYGSKHFVSSRFRYRDNVPHFNRTSQYDYSDSQSLTLSNSGGRRRVLPRQQRRECPGTELARSDVMEEQLTIRIKKLEDLMAQRNWADGSECHRRSARESIQKLRDSMKPRLNPLSKNNVKKAVELSPQSSDSFIGLPPPKPPHTTPHPAEEQTGCTDGYTTGRTSPSNDGNQFSQYRGQENSHLPVPGYLPGNSCGRPEVQPLLHSVTSSRMYNQPTAPQLRYHDTITTVGAQSRYPYTIRNDGTAMTFYNYGYNSTAMGPTSGPPLGSVVGPCPPLVAPLGPPQARTDRYGPNPTGPHGSYLTVKNTLDPVSQHSQSTHSLPHPHLRREKLTATSDSILMPSDGQLYEAYSKESNDEVLALPGDEDQKGSREDDSSVDLLSMDEDGILWDLDQADTMYISEDLDSETAGDVDSSLLSGSVGLPVKGEGHMNVLEGIDETDEYSSYFGLPATRRSNRGQGQRILKDIGTDGGTGWNTDGRRTHYGGEVNGEHALKADDGGMVSDIVSVRDKMMKFLNEDNRQHDRRPVHEKAGVRSPWKAKLVLNEAGANTDAPRSVKFTKTSDDTPGAQASSNLQEESEEKQKVLRSRLDCDTSRLRFIDDSSANSSSSYTPVKPSVTKIMDSAVRPVIKPRTHSQTEMKVASHRQEVEEEVIQQELKSHVKPSFDEISKKLNIMTSSSDSLEYLPKGKICPKKGSFGKKISSGDLAEGHHQSISGNVPNTSGCKLEKLLNGADWDNTTTSAHSLETPNVEPKGMKLRSSDNIAEYIEHDEQLMSSISIATTSSEDKNPATHREEEESILTSSLSGNSLDELPKYEHAQLKQAERLHPTLADEATTDDEHSVDDVLTSSRHRRSPSHRTPLLVAGTITSEEDLAKDAEESTDFDLESDLEKFQMPMSLGCSGYKKRSKKNKVLTHKKVLTRGGASSGRRFSVHTGQVDESSDVSDAKRDVRSQSEARRRRRVALFCVFRYLDTKTRSQMALVCREWRRVSLHPELWRKVELKNEAVSSTFLTTLSQWCPRLECLTLEGLQCRGPRLGETIEEHHQNTKGCLEPGLEELLKCGQDSLKYLKVVACGNLITDKFLWMASCYCRLLQKLVYMSSTDPISPQVLWAIGGGCPGVTTLIVPPLFPCLKQKSFNDKCLLLIAKFYPDLLELGIGGQEISIQGLLPLVQGCQRLQYLELDHVTELTANHVTALCQAGLRQLAVLELNGTLISPEAVRLIYKSCRHLKKLQIVLTFQDFYEDISKKNHQQEYQDITRNLQEMLSEPGVGNVLSIQATPVE